MAVDQLYIDEDYIEDGHFQTGIEIVWAQRRILVPRLAMELVQTTPTVVYNLDLNAFRLALKDLEDSPEGMAFPDTHRHNTTVVLAGVTYARVIELINDYTVEFEDGQYAVNLIGANSNVADRTVVNQVSVRVSNSAGLIEVNTAGGSGASAAEVWSHPTRTLTAAPAYNGPTVAQIWEYASRTLTSAPGYNGPTAEQIAAAILAAAATTPVHADVRRVNNTVVKGSGQLGDEWGPV